jgi:hypothetical protein
MGTLHTIDAAATPRAGERRGADLASELDLPSWEEFTDARERFFANLASAPLPPPAPRGRAEDTVVTAG